ncbi:MAG: hypothetical protein KBC00_01465 [Candidatus Levybacteria bacterium]|nr:hypothetical protein [Candidatus Levybacteria bacterium]
MGILSYPFLVVLFWYKEGLLRLLLYFRSFDDYCIRLFSLHGLFSSYFKPLKNEYRKNLVLFSVFFGMVVKTFLIIVSLSILFIVLLFEGLLIFIYVLFPVLPLFIIFLSKYL